MPGNRPACRGAGVYGACGAYVAKYTKIGWLGVDAARWMKSTAFER